MMDCTLAASAVRRGIRDKGQEIREEHALLSSLISHLSSLISHLSSLISYP
jgi:hypothetical protein